MQLRRVLLLSCLLFPGIAPTAIAGLNAGAVAHMYWQTGNAAGQASRTSTSGQPQLVVTVTGLHSFRGADVQLFAFGNSGVPLPDAWKANGTGGCNDGNAEYKIGGYGGAYPSAFVGVPSLAIAQQTELFDDPGSPCLTPGGRAFFWLQAAGTAGAVRNSGTEYGLWALRFDVRGTAAGGASDCAGDMGDAGGPVPISFGAGYHFPCASPVQGAYVAILDANNAIDYVPFAAGQASLGWQAPPEDLDYIAPTVQVLSPNGGEVLFGGIATTIQIQASDNVAPATMDLDLSTDGGANYGTQIAHGIPYATSFGWTPPNFTSSTCRIRATIRDGAGNAAADASDANFSLTPGIKVTIVQPNGGYSYMPGDYVTFGNTITPGGSTPISMAWFLSSDGGQTYPTQLYPATGLAPYLPEVGFPLPNVLGDHSRAKVIVTGSNGSVGSDVSNGDFRIATQPNAFVEILGPNGGEVLDAGSSRTVQLYATTSKSFTTMDVALSVDGGASFPIPIATNAAFGKSFSITVPDAPTNHGRLRVTVRDSGGYSATDMSDQDFLIPGLPPELPTVTLVSPNGGEEFPGLTQVIVASSRTGFFASPTMTLSLSTDDGATYPIPLATNVGYSSSYTVNLPNHPTAYARLRIQITDAYTGSATDESDASFTIGPILPISVQLNAPNGGDSLNVGSELTIVSQVASAVAVSSMDLSLSIDGGATFPYAIATNVMYQTSFPWTVPDVPTSQGRLRIKVHALGGNTASDTTDANFVIAPNVWRVTLGVPNGGGTYQSGNSFPVQSWLSPGSPAIAKTYYYYSTDGGATYPYSLLPAPGFINGFAQTAAVHFPAGLQANHVRVKVNVETFDGTSKSDVSDGMLRASPTPDAYVEVLSPNGGEVVAPGVVPVGIYGTSAGLPLRMDVALSADGGATYPIPLATNIPFSNSYSWSVTGPATSRARLRVTMRDDRAYTAIDASDADFTIAGTSAPPTINLTAPNGGEVLVIGSQATASSSETPIGGIATMNLDLSTDGGATFPIPLAANVPYTSPRTWTVPNAPTTHARLRIWVHDFNGLDATDVSDADFIIQAPPVPPNAGATAGLYWVDGSGSGLPNSTTADGQPRLVITVKGMKSLRAGEVQLYVHGKSNQLPSAWLGNGTGGCNEGRFQFVPGGSGVVYPNPLTGVPGLAMSANGEALTLGACPVNTGWAMMRLKATGSAAAACDSATEYALWTIAFDLRGTALGGAVNCDGDLSNSPRPAQIFPLFFDPCAAPNRGAVLALTDANGDVTYVPFTRGYPSLFWWNTFAGPTSVALSGLESSQDDRGVSLRWNLSDPVEVSGVDVERREAGASGPSAAQVVVRGLRPEARMSWLDPGALPGIEYIYDVRGRLRDGTEVMGSATVSTPRAVFLLRAPAPNPFGDGTSFRYSLASQGTTQLDVLDAGGRRLRTLESGPRAAGFHQVAWDGRDAGGHAATAGVYFIRLASGGRTAVRRVVRIR